MISDTLALTQFFLNKLGEHKSGRNAAEGETLMAFHLSLAISHEIRAALNLIELSLTAHEQRDAGLRDHLVRSIELPMLESMARGMFGGGMNPAAAEKLRLSIPLDSAENAEMMGENEIQSGESKSALSSRLVARIGSMKVLASYNREIPWVRWRLRLDRVKMELIRMLEIVMASAREAESMAAGRGA